MEATPEIVVTVSAELMKSLRGEADRLGVPIEYLIAGLVLDTFEGSPTRKTPPLRAAS
jgi:hypothetical protein